MLVPFPLVLLLRLPVMVHLVLLFGSVIRRPAVAGRERGTRDAMAASWFGYDGAEHWELQWDTSFMRLGHSKYGVTGFARVISRSSGGPVPVEPIRAHLCRHNPCKANWKHDSKYGKAIPRPIHFQSWSPNAHRAIPAPVPPPAVVHLHPVDASLEAGGDDDEVSEGDPESSSSSSSSSSSLITRGRKKFLSLLKDDLEEAWTQRGIEEVHSYHIAEFDLSRVPEGVPGGDPPPVVDPPLEDDDVVAGSDGGMLFYHPDEEPEDDLHFVPVDRPPTPPAEKIAPPPEDHPPPEDGPPPPAAPEEVPASKCDASAVAEPVPPHTLPLDATPVASTPQSDLPPLDAPAGALDAPAGAPLKTMQAAAPLPREELAAVAATEATEAAEGAAVAAIVSPSQLAEDRVLGALLKLARDIRQPRHYIGYSAFMCFCLSRGCRAYIWEGGDRIDLLHSYAPWAIDRCPLRCAVDGVCCCLVPSDEDVAVASMVPVSETHP